MANITDILRRMDDAALQAQIESEKAMHSAGNLAEFFDGRGDTSDPKTQSLILGGFMGAALDNDITHDYLIATSSHIAELRALVGTLMEAINAKE